MRAKIPQALAALVAALLSCSGASTPSGHAGDSRTPATAAAPAQGPGAPRPKVARGSVSEAEAQKSRPDLPPDQRALLVMGQPGQPEERWIDAEAAEAAGYTLLDLSDDWTPFIFAEQSTPDGQLLHNRYRRIFIGLANDELDEDGEPLEPGSKNYLELYGIPPALSVLRARFIQDAEHPCHDQESAEAIEAVETVTYVPPEGLKKDARKQAKVREELEKARRKARVGTLEELAEKQPALAPKVKMLARRAAEKPAMAAVERRLTCEGLLGKGAFKHTEGIYDDAMRLAVRKFQQKHMIYEANYLRRKTVDALARPLLDNDYDGLVRALRERVVSAAEIVEDGSASKTGKNLVDDYLKVAIEQLQLTDAASALAFFKRHPAGEFKRLRAAIKLPARPDYYSDNMDLSLEIDRGDVWYDLPWGADGHYKPQPRKKYPSMTLYTKSGGKRIALARWRTTIGGWRAEQAGNGYEYFRYKQSDVGPRVIRNVVSGPVWIAPASTPIRSLTKGKTVNQKWMRVVNYDELGPGYLSAYGVVAGYFVVPGQNGRPDWDNGVRAHGSSDYLSIYSANGFSHGCHRLPNHIAVRMYSFILKHRNMTVVGDKPMNFYRQFLFKESVYEIRLPSRGFYYVLEPPLPVNVLEGEIKGDAKKPIAGYVATPWIKYPPGLPVPAAPDSAEAKAGGGGGGASSAGGDD